MIGAIVTHKKFGCGIITEQSASIITVSFSGIEKKFVFPDAFENFLSTDDAKLISEIDEQKKIIEAKKKAVVSPPPQLETTPIISKTGKAKRIVRTIERSNIAFKCNFCDGGCSDSCIGFKGVCSDEIMRYNIMEAKHVWCASESPCKKYIDGEITREDLIQQFSCYESTMLSEWKASAGVVQNGENKGKPMKLIKVQNNSLAVLTTRFPNATDDKRFIFAVFLVDESYEGDGWEEGFVTNHSKWRIELTPSEATQLLFWNYYVNANAPEKKVFGSGLHRYLSDMQAAQILKDIIKIKSSPEEKEFAKQFLNHFCDVTGLDVNMINEPAGALITAGT